MLLVFLIMWIVYNDRQVIGLPAYHHASPMANKLLQQTERYFFILCIGDHLGRAERENHWQQLGLIHNQHYLRFL